MPREALRPFRSPLAQDALLDALNRAGPLRWALRDSIYYGVYLRAWHGEHKLRIYGDGPYLLDLGDELPPDEIEVPILAAAQATDDEAGLSLIPFPAAPLDLYDDQPPRDSQESDGPWSAIGESLASADPGLTIVAFQVGTPASFYSENPRQPEGHHFDSRGKGTTDIEIDLHSPEMMLRMKNRAPQGSADQRIMRSGKWAFLKNDGPGGFYREFPGLVAVARKWSETLGRDIEFRLRIAAEPVSSVKTPGRGGPIELFRIDGGAARAPARQPSAPKAGLWGKIRGLFGSSSPSPGTIEVDEAGVKRWLSGGKCEAVKWNALSRVEVMTTDDGPAVDDVFWVLQGSDGTGCVIPSETSQADAILKRLQALPGFDNETFIEAMSSTKNQRFVVWSKP
jgi:hypothetical protein